MLIYKSNKELLDRKKLTIAMLGHKRIPSREGGVEVVVEELSVRMVKKGHKVVCYNRNGHHVSGRKYGNKRLKIYKGIHIRHVLTINRRGLAAMTSSVFASILAAFGKYDTVHIHAEGAAVLCWLPKLMGKKVIVTVHGLDHKREKWGKLASIYIMQGEKNAVKYADEIIVLSKGVQNYFQKVYGRSTQFIPNGVERPEKVNDTLIRDMFLIEKDEYFLFLGRIVPEKGIKYLIKAFKEVKTDKKLVIAGGSSDTNAFVSEVKKLASDDNRIIFTDFVQGEVYGSLFSNAYVYVLPSDLEGMPLSLLEAMSYGNCCIVSDIDECTEVVGDYGEIFKHGNITSLRQKMQRLVDEPELVRKYREDAADYICQKYNWDDVVEKTLTLYQKNQKDYI